MNKLVVALGQFWHLILQGLSGIFGKFNWQPPQWLIWLLRSIFQLASSFRQKPFQGLLFLLVSVILCAASGYGYRWWQARPKPVTVDFTVSAPARTELENKSPPNPFVFDFNSSVAPISLVDKIVTEGIKLSPSIPGVWRWVGDKQLEFRPNSDWPIASHFSVKLDKSIVTSGIELSKWAVEFDTAAFTATVDKPEFYQDPLDPALKKAIFGSASLTLGLSLGNSQTCTAFDIDCSCTGKDVLMMIS